MPSLHSQFCLHPPGLYSHVLSSPASVTASCVVPLIQDVNVGQHSASFCNRHTFPLAFPAHGMGLHSLSPLLCPLSSPSPVSTLHMNFYHITCSPRGHRPWVKKSLFLSNHGTSELHPSLPLLYLERVLITCLKLASKYSLLASASQVANTTDMFNSV